MSSTSDPLEERILDRENLRKETLDKLLASYEILFRAVAAEALNGNQTCILAINNDQLIWKSQN